MDFRGEICGYGHLASRPYLYFATPNLDLNIAFCVKECPKTTGYFLFIKSNFIFKKKY